MSVALIVIAGRLSPARVGAALRASSPGRAAIEAARFALYVGLPYLALLTGAFTPRDVGLQGAPAPGLILGWSPETWARAVGQAALLTGLTLAALAALAWQIRRADGYAPDALGIDSGSAARAIRDGVYAETHWSFYRALPAVVFGAAHWAALAGLAVWAIEALLAGRRDRRQPVEWMLAGASAAYFALTGGNAWLAILMQIAIRAPLARLALGRPRRDADEAREFIV